MRLQLKCWVSFYFSTQRTLVTCKGNVLQSSQKNKSNTKQLFCKSMTCDTRIRQNATSDSDQTRAEAENIKYLSSIGQTV